MKTKYTEKLSVLVSPDTKKKLDNLVKALNAESISEINLSNVLRDAIKEYLKDG